jgi:hypothetical protein
MKNKNSEITKYGIIAILVYFISRMKQTENTISENTQDEPSRVPTEDNNGSYVPTIPPIKDFDPWDGRVPRNPTIPPVDNVYNDGEIPEGEDNTRHPPANLQNLTGDSRVPSDGEGWLGEPLDEGGFVREDSADPSILREIVDPRGNPPRTPPGTPPRNPNAPPIGSGIGTVSTSALPPRRSPISGLRPTKNPYGLNSSGEEHPYSRLIFPQVIGKPKDLNIHPLLFGDLHVSESFPVRSVFRSGVGYSFDNPIIDPFIPGILPPKVKIGLPEPLPPKPVRLHGLALWKFNYYKNLKK